MTSQGLHDPDGYASFSGGLPYAIIALKISLCLLNKKSIPVRLPK